MNTPQHKSNHKRKLKRKSKMSVNLSLSLSLRVKVRPVYEPKKLEVCLSLNVVRTRVLKSALSYAGVWAEISYLAKILILSLCLKLEFDPRLCVPLNLML